MREIRCPEIAAALERLFIEANTELLRREGEDSRRLSLRRHRPSVGRYWRNC